MKTKPPATHAEAADRLARALEILISGGPAGDEKGPFDWPRCMDAAVQAAREEVRLYRTANLPTLFPS